MLKISTPPEKFPTPPEKMSPLPEKNLNTTDKISTPLKFLNHTAPKKFLHPPPRKFRNPHKNMLTGSPHPHHFSLFFLLLSTSFPSLFQKKI